MFTPVRPTSQRHEISEIRNLLSRAASAAPRRGAAGIAFETGAVAHQSEIAALFARLAFIALGLGFSALASRSRPCLRALLALCSRERLLLQKLGRRKP